MTDTGITLSGVTKRFGDAVAVDDLTAHLSAGSLTALLGPSGCGKSTTLAMIAGLLAPDSGDIRLGAASLLRIPAERRPVGLVFQKPLLFPHLSVEQNVAFGLRMRRVDRRETRRLVHAMLDRVQLPEVRRRRVGELSGGQEQRVALARALVLDPQVLLLDEPFSQLDAVLRAQMRALVRELHDESGLTTVFVTHDQAEAVEVADTITLLLDGRVAGCGDPELFYRRPPSLAAARFFGAVNEIAGRVASGAFVSDDGAVRTPCDGPAGDAVLVIRPEAVLLQESSSAPTESNSPGTVAGTAVAARFAGAHIAVDVRLAGGSCLTVHAPIGTQVTIGAAVGLRLHPDACSVFAALVP